MCAMKKKSENSENVGQKQKGGEKISEAIRTTLPRSIDNCLRRKASYNHNLLKTHLCSDIFDFSFIAHRAKMKVGGKAQRLC